MLSTEVRELMVKAYEKSHNATEVARNFSVSRTTVYDHVKRMRETGTVAVQTDKRGRNVIFLPPYSPDLNPIEMMWSKIKAILRKMKIRTVSELDSGINFAFSQITPSDCFGWFSAAIS